MELVDGESLREILQKEGGRLDVGRVVRLAKQIADALAAAHDVGIVHRDVKPENVMISVDSAVLAGERTKVLDFGIAVVPKNELSTSQQPFLPHSDPGQFAGTIPYMAPEQLDCQGHGPITPKTDVYQLGVLMYELLSGQTPFAYTGMHGLSLVMCIVQQDPRPLTALAPDVPNDLAYLILRMLAKEAGERPSMRDVLLELRRIEPSGIGSLSQAPVSRVGEGLGRRSLLGMGLAGVAVLAGVGWWMMAESSTVTWQVQSEPTGAEVLDQAGQSLGRTPWQEVRARDIGHKEIRLRLAGYRSESLLLDSGRDYRRTVVLTKSVESSPGSRPATAR